MYRKQRISKIVVLYCATMLVSGCSVFPNDFGFGEQTRSAKVEEIEGKPTDTQPRGLERPTKVLVKKEENAVAKLVDRAVGKRHVFFIPNWTAHNGASIESDFFIGRGLSQFMTAVVREPIKTNQTAISRVVITGKAGSRIGLLLSRWGSSPMEGTQKSYKLTGGKDEFFICHTFVKDYDMFSLRIFPSVNDVQAAVEVIWSDIIWSSSKTCDDDQPSKKEYFWG